MINWWVAASQEIFCTHNWKIWDEIAAILPQRKHYYNVAAMCIVPILQQCPFCYTTWGISKRGILPLSCNVRWLLCAFFSRSFARVCSLRFSFLCVEGCYSAPSTFCLGRGGKWSPECIIQSLVHRGAKRSPERRVHSPCFFRLCLFGDTSCSIKQTIEARRSLPCLQFGQWGLNHIVLSLLDTSVKWSRRICFVCSHFQGCKVVLQGRSGL